MTLQIGGKYPSRNPKLRKELKKQKSKERRKNPYAKYKGYAS